jgi:RNA polymerase subunit RPABC4/transcription elongation factor Spt4
MSRKRKKICNNCHKITRHNRDWECIECKKKEVKNEHSRT